MRMLLVLAWRNLGRNRRRTLLNFGAIAFAAMTMTFHLALQAGVMDQAIENAVKRQSGHLQVQAPDYLKERDVNMTVDQPDRVLAAADALPETVGAVGRLTTGMLAAKGDNTFVAMVVGTDARREMRASTWPAMVRQGSFLDASDPLGVVIGDQLAKNLEAKLGDEISLIGQAADGSIAAFNAHIRGIIHMGQPDADRTFAMVNLATLQDIMVMPGRVNAVVVLLKKYELVPQAAAALQRAVQTIDPQLQVLTWKQLVPGVDDIIRMKKVSNPIINLLLFLVVAFGILNTFLMSAFERFREFGVMMAIGIRPRACGALLLLESQFLALSGFAVGFLLGVAVSLYFGWKGIPLGGAQDVYEQYGFSGSLYPMLNWSVLQVVFIEVWLTTLLVACYPAWKITRFRPVEALRHV